MGWFGPQSGSCGCCGDGDCPDCDEVTYFTVAGLGNAVCAGCAGLNGSYVFRTVGNPGTCGWSGPWGGDNCGLVGPPYHYVGDGGSACWGSADLWGISFSTVAGKIRIRVVLEISAIETNAFNIVQYGSSVVGVFEDDFDTCADAVGASLPLIELIDNGSCVSPLGDFCGVGSATVTLG